MACRESLIGPGIIIPGHQQIFPAIVGRPTLVDLASVAHQFTSSFMPTPYRSDVDKLRDLTRKITGAIACPHFKEARLPVYT
jgi:hypothetical protein